MMVIGVRSFQKFDLFLFELERAGISTTGYLSRARSGTSFLVSLLEAMK